MKRYLDFQEKRLVGQTVNGLAMAYEVPEKQLII